MIINLKQILKYILLLIIIVFSMFSLYKILGNISYDGHIEPLFIESKLDYDIIKVKNSDNKTFNISVSNNVWNLITEGETYLITYKKNYLIKTMC